MHKPAVSRSARVCTEYVAHRRLSLDVLCTNVSNIMLQRGPRWHSGQGAVLQIGRSLVRFQMVSLEFFIDIILPIALRPGVDSAPNRNEYQEHFLEVKAAGT